MLTYQVRKRVIRFEAGSVPEFPAASTVRLHLLPGQPFGETAGGGRMVLKGSAAKLEFNSNNGQFSATSSDPLKPLDVTIEEPLRTISLCGRVLTVEESVDSIERLAALLESLSFAIPWLLNLSFADPPYVERVEGEVAGVPFRWELAQWKLPFQIVTQETQEAAFVAAWDKFEILTVPHRRRLIAAVHYFYVACRLFRTGDTVGEFMSEGLLNMAKVLEVLFPGPTSIDAARVGLRTLGYPDHKIEAHFVPVLALRNQIDVGHVHLSVFGREELSIIHSYVDIVESEFRGLLSRVCARIASGSWDVPPYDDLSPAQEILEVIRRMDDALSNWAPQQNGNHGSDV